MGTETCRYYLQRWKLLQQSVKLNNPHKGTEDGNLFRLLLVF